MDRRGPTLIVLDASLMVAWLLREPALMVEPQLYDDLPGQSIVVPTHWPMEIGSALSVNVRRGRIPLYQFDEIMRELADFQIALAPAAPISDIATLTRFALAEKLTVYDAVYVQLAAAYQLTLATLDHEMRRAATRLGIPVLPV